MNVIGHITITDTNITMPLLQNDMSEKKQKEVDRKKHPSS